MGSNFSEKPWIEDPTDGTFAHKMATSQNSPIPWELRDAVPNKPIELTNKEKLSVVGVIAILAIPAVITIWSIL